MTDGSFDKPGISKKSEDPATAGDSDWNSKLRHDLRTPINHIVGYSELLLEEAENTALESFTADLCKIHAAGKTLLEIIDALVVSPGTASITSQRKAADDRFSLTQSVPPVTLADTSGTASQLSGHLLVVDDNETNRDMLSRRLRHQGYRVSVAEDGLRALSVIASQPVDLVLLDILMPELDGYETLKRLKADPRFRDIPVIMISALDELQSVVRCIEQGAEDYLPKPFNPVLLRARIGACLEKKRLRDQEILYLRDVSEITAAASAVEQNCFSGDQLTHVGQRPDELGQLARVFQKMAREVVAREQRFKEQIENLRIEIDASKKERQVAELTETDFFQKLQAQARSRLRHKKNKGKPE